MKFLKKFLIIVVIIFAIIGFLFLITNRCFFFTTYKGGDKNIFIPRFCFLYKEGGLTVASFCSLRSKDSLQKEIDNYLSTFSKRESGVYVKDDLYIETYNVIEMGTYRRIVLTYDPLYEQQ